jgi:hypothetical protein
MVGYLDSIGLPGRGEVAIAGLVFFKRRGWSPSRVIGVESAARANDRSELLVKVNIRRGLRRLVATAPGNNDAN